MCELVKLGDLFYFKNGRSFKKQEWKEMGLPIIRIQNLNNISAGYNYFEGEYDKLIEVNSGDLLFSWSGTVGSSFGPHIWGREKGVLNQHIYKLSKKKAIDTKYAFYCLKKITKEIEKSVVGAVGLVHVTKKSLVQFEIPLPPLLEQQRIVAKIDYAFSEIENAINFYQKRVNELSRLQLVCLRKNFDDLLGEWDTVLLGDICDLVGGGTPSKNKQEYYDGDIPWATVRDMNCEELSVTEHKITELGLKNSSSKVIPKNNLVIASRVGLGKVCILNQNTAINQDLRGVIPKKGLEIDNRFLFYWFKEIANEIIAAGSGLTVKGVKLPFLNSMSLPMPPLKDQQNIVSKLDVVFAESETAIKSTEKIVKKYSDLKASFLSKELQSNFI